MRMIQRSGVTLAAILWAFISLAQTVSCDRAPKTPPTPAPREPVHAVATVYPMADVVRKIGDRAVHVEWLLESGQSLDQFQPDAEVKDRLQTADLVVTGGANEPWAIEGFDDPARGQRIIRLDLLETARQSHGATAQLWLDPLIVRESIGVIANRLIGLRPASESNIRIDAQALVGQIDSVLSDYRTRLDGLAGVKVITLSDDFSALTSRFGIVEIRPVEMSPLKLSDLDISRIRRTAKEQGASAMLVGNDLPPQVVRDLADRTGLRIIQLDALGTSATAGTSGGAHFTYINLLRYNLEQLLTLR